MSDMLETLWAQFGLETAEHLELIEPILSASGPAAGDPEAVGQLFRSFHSIKGLARAMDLSGMEQVAHRAEDLLGLVRDGRIPLDPPLADLLLAGLDQLKRLNETAVAARADQPADPAVLEALAVAFRRAEAGGAVGDAASATADAPAQSPAIVADAALPDADDEMIELFAALLEERLPELAAIVGPAAEEPAGRAALADALDQLRSAATVMDFEPLAEDLAALAVALDTEGDQGRRDRLRLLGEARGRAALVGELTGRPVGVDELTRRTALLLRPTARAAIQELTDLVGQLELSMADAGAALAPDAVEAAQSAHIAALVFGLLGQERAAELLLLIEDVAARLAQGDLPPEAALVRPIADALALLDPRRLDAPDREADIDADAARDAAEGVRAALRFGVGGGAAEARVIAGRRIKGAFAELLTPSQTLELEALLAAPDAHLYEVLAHIEADESIGAGVVAVLARQSTVITNRTVLTDRASWFDFLTVSALAPDAFAAALGDVDQGLVCLKAVSVVGPDGARVLLGAGVEEPAAPEGTAAAPAAATGQTQAAATPGSQVLRVRSEAVDRFINLIGDLRTAVTGLARAAEDERLAEALAEARRLVGERAEHRAVLEPLIDLHRLVAAHEDALDRALTRLQAGALDLRVVPIDTVFNRFPRVVRDLAGQLGKEVALSLEGRDVRIDKSMVETLVDPLMHMVRNAVDHGVERPADRRAAGKPAQAQVQLRAAQRGAEVAIEIIDDGRGLDVEAIRAKAVQRGLIGEEASRRLPPAQIHRFIFAPGFSTAAQVTATSGRGVGMDVVAAAVSKLGGSIEIESRQGAGSRFTLRMPVSAAMQNALLVALGDTEIAIAERAVAEVRVTPRGEIAEVSGLAAFRHRGAWLPLYRLDVLLGFAAEPAPWPERVTVVVVDNGRALIGLAVDRVRRRLELFLKDLHPALARFPAIGGVSVIGEGQVVLMLDADGLIQLALRSPEAARP